MMLLPLILFVLSGFAGCGPAPLERNAIKTLPEKEKQAPQSSKTRTNSDVLQDEGSFDQTNQKSIVANPDEQEEEASGSEQEDDTASEDMTAEEMEVTPEEDGEDPAAEKSEAEILAMQEAAKKMAEEADKKLAAEAAAKKMAEEEAAKLKAEEMEKARLALVQQGNTRYINDCQGCHQSANLGADPRVNNKNEAALIAKLQNGHMGTMLNLGQIKAIAAAVADLEN